MSKATRGLWEKGGSCVGQGSREVLLWTILSLSAVAWWLVTSSLVQKSIIYRGAAYKLCNKPARGQWAAVAGEWVGLPSAAPEALSLPDTEIHTDFCTGHTVLCSPAASGSQCLPVRQGSTQHTAV